MREDLTQPGVNGLWPDLPLPGLYPCLTVQCNLTVHQSSRLGKFVLVVREPVAQTELYRQHSGLAIWSTVSDAYSGSVGAVPGVLDYLMGWETPTPT